MKLIGFRDISHFNYAYSCSAPIFITADIHNGLGGSSHSLNGGFSNSRSTFASLYRTCIKLQQYAIVFGCTRSNSKPRLYAMYPTRAEGSTKLGQDKSGSGSADTDATGGKDFPQGFLLIKLPWLEDVRALPAAYINEINNANIGSQGETGTVKLEYTYEENSGSPYDETLVQQMKSIVNQHKLQVYNPQDYPNPSLNFFTMSLNMSCYKWSMKSKENNSLTESNGVGMTLLGRTIAYLVLVTADTYIFEIAWYFIPLTQK